MKPYGRVMVVTDCLQHGRVAEGRAAALCDELAVEAIELLTVAASEGNSFEPSQAAHSKVQAWFGASKLRVTHALRFRDPVDAILAHGDAFEASLVVAPVHADKVCAGPASLCRSDELASRVERPLLLVKRHCRGPYRSVLLAVNVERDCEDIVRFALSISSQAHLTFLHVCDPQQVGDSPEDRASAWGAAQRKLGTLIGRFGRGRHLFSRLVLHGPVGATLLGHADQLSVDLVVMGKSIEAEGGKALMARLVNGLGCDLLLVPRATHSSMPSAA